ncbi:MAG TPA: cytochrome c oxidase subunit 4 [Acidimicrobiales bacterium]|nr:cytochrome c oxidase subunit 4 [Acidimicrobiales bacterium]
MLLSIGAYLVVVSGIYWFFSYEEAGSVLLLLSAGLALIVGGYLWWATREHAASPQTAGADEDEAEHYLPHASIWPLGVGAGSVVLANGLALGLWAAVPGAIVVAASVVGYARQSRHRD